MSWNHFNSEYERIECAKVYARKYVNTLIVAYRCVCVRVCACVCAHLFKCTYPAERINLIRSNMVCVWLQV